ncbi:RHOMBOID-like protein 5 isoform X2 [Prosopis cineraria]|uniref:RHOMBOID-like protein 5 isoform X2 n=1 Tax=Prosopis cineraria TaxID=364024 RepID=UPI0024104585|nr:RHOMBOID-like protein 5 isoform X2 [Prosopis cineraria]
MGKSPPSPPSDIETAHGGRKGRPSPPYDVDTVHGGRRSRPSSPLDVETDRGETAHGGHKGRPSPPYDVETAHGGSGGRPSPLSDTETRRGHRKSRSETPQPTPRFSPPLPKPWFPWLQKLGALQKELVVEDNEGWRLLTCMFLHAGVIHLIANMFSLLSIGIRLEQEFGFVRIGLLYTLSGFAGSLISMLHLEASAKPTISVGASGALFGLLGAMLSELLTNWTIYENKCAALITLLVISALNLSLGFLPRVDNSAHVGGFTSGFLLGFVLLMRPQYGYVNRKHIPPGYDVKRKSKFTFCQYLLFVVSLIILIVGYAYSLIMLFKK